MPRYYNEEKRFYVEEEKDGSMLGAMRENFSDYFIKDEKLIL